MGCGCLVALASVISPRLGLFLVWIFTDRLSQAFDSFWIGFAGFLLLPWTTLAYAVLHQVPDGVSSFGWFLVAFAFLVDIGTHFGFGREERRRTRAA